MNRLLKVFALALVIVMLFSSSVFATTPSKELESGGAVGDGMTSPSSTDNEPTPEAPADIADIGAAVQAAGSGIAYFDVATKAKILAIGNVSVMNELVPLNFAGTFSSGTSLWQFNTVYPIGKVLVAAFGVVTGRVGGVATIVWYIVPAKVVPKPGGVGTLVQIVYTKDIFNALTGKQGYLAILS